MSLSARGKRPFARAVNALETIAAVASAEKSRPPRAIDSSLEGAPRQRKRCGGSWAQRCARAAQKRRLSSLWSTDRAASKQPSRWIAVHTPRLLFPIGLALAHLGCGSTSATDVSGAGAGGGVGTTAGGSTTHGSGGSSVAGASGSTATTGSGGSAGTAGSNGNGGASSSGASGSGGVDAGTPGQGGQGGAGPS